MLLKYCQPTFFTLNFNYLAKPFFSIDDKNTNQTIAKKNHITLSAL